MISLCLQNNGLLKRAAKITTGREGFTLIETMVGMMIFAIGISAVLYLEVVAIRNHTRARVHVNEIHATSGVGEALKLAGWDDPQMQGSTDGIVYPASSLPIKDSDKITYTVYTNALVEGTRVAVATSKLETSAHLFSIGYVQTRIMN